MCVMITNYIIIDTMNSDIGILKFLKYGQTIVDNNEKLDGEKK